MFTGVCGFWGKCLFYKGLGCGVEELYRQVRKEIVDIPNIPS